MVDWDSSTDWILLRDARTWRGAGRPLRPRRSKPSSTRSRGAKWRGGDMTDNANIDNIVKLAEYIEELPPRSPRTAPPSISSSCTATGCASAIRAAGGSTGTAAIGRSTTPSLRFIGRANLPAISASTKKPASDTKSIRPALRPASKNLRAAIRRLPSPSNIGIAIPGCSARPAALSIYAPEDCGLRPKPTASARRP